MLTAKWRAIQEKIRRSMSGQLMIEPSPGRSTATTQQILARHRRRLRADLRRPGKSARRLHTLRIEVKTLRYLLEECAPVNLRSSQTELKLLVQLQQSLGDLRDSWQLRRRLKEELEERALLSVVIDSAGERREKLSAVCRKRRKKLLHALPPG